MATLLPRSIRENPTKLKILESFDLMKSASPVCKNLSDLFFLTFLKSTNFIVPLLFVTQASRTGRVRCLQYAFEY